MIKQGNKASEYATARTGETEEQWTVEQTAVWKDLYRNQLPNVEKYACRDYLEGSRILRLPENRIPSLAELNERITPRTGWKTIRASVRYTDAEPWYRHFGRREFLITDYMRSTEELRFTPEPDMFHDIFGHLPFMVLPRYTALQEMFAPAFWKANRHQRENIKRLAWFSTEFGLTREDGELKIFGAGLISGGAELDNVVSGRVRMQPFTVENVIRRDKAVWSHNEVLFVFDSIRALRNDLAQYFDSIE